MAVETIVSGVALSTDKPAAVLAHVGVEHPVPELIPADFFGSFCPKRFWVLCPSAINLVVAAHRGDPPVVSAGQRTEPGSQARERQITNAVAGTQRARAACTQPR